MSFSGFGRVGNEDISGLQRGTIGLSSPVHRWILADATRPKRARLQSHPVLHSHHNTMQALQCAKPTFAAAKPAARSR